MVAGRPDSDGADRTMAALMDHAPALSAVEAMERMAAEAEAVGDRSAPWLRALALSLEAANCSDLQTSGVGIANIGGPCAR